MYLPFANLQRYKIGKQNHKGESRSSKCQKQSFPKTWLYYNIDFIEFFLFWVSLITHNLHNYIIYIHSFLLYYLNSNIFFFIAWLTFRSRWKKFLYSWWTRYPLTRSSNWCDSEYNRQNQVHFPFSRVFFLEETVLVLFVSCLVLSQFRYSW